MRPLVTLFWISGNVYTGFKATCKGSPHLCSSWILRDGFHIIVWSVKTAWQRKNVLPLILCYIPSRTSGRTDGYRKHVFKYLGSKWIREGSVKSYTATGFQKYFFLEFQTPWLHSSSISIRETRSMGKFGVHKCMEVATLTAVLNWRSYCVKYAQKNRK